MNVNFRFTRWVLGAGAVAGLLAAGPAGAHVTADPREAPAGAYTKLNFRVPHGCDGSPTTGVSVRIPDGVVSVKPEVNPGWTIDITTGPYDESVELHGETVTEGVREVSWTGGPLPDEHLTEFGLSVRTPDRPGETLYFPTVQTCEQGVHRWTAIPVEGEDEPDEPAPAVRLVAAGGQQDATSGAGSADGLAGTVDGELAAGGDGGTDGVAVAGLVAGLAGLVLGATALGIVLRRKAQPA